MRRLLARAAHGVLKHFGLQITRRRETKTSDIDEFTLGVYNKVKSETMTNVERVHSVVQGVRHAIRHDLPGAFVECGVWRGGASMSMALTLLDLGVTDREIYLYDTFEGMSAPTEHDVTNRGIPASEKFREVAITDSSSDWCRSTIDVVRGNMKSTGYPIDRVHFVKGKVEDTVPGTIPERIALLRLDTDWYESTRHEMEHLFPLLVSRGLLILDDYGRWLGSRKAVDEYFESNGICLHLSRIDATAREGVKFPAG